MIYAKFCCFCSAYKFGLQMVCNFFFAKAFSPQGQSTQNRLMHTPMQQIQSRGEQEAWVTCNFRHVIAIKFILSSPSNISAAEPPPKTCKDHGMTICQGTSEMFVYGGAFIFHFHLSYVLQGTGEGYPLCHISPEVNVINLNWHLHL